MEFDFWSDVFQSSFLQPTHQKPDQRVLKAIFAEACYKAIEVLEAEAEVVLRDDEHYSFEQSLRLAEATALVLRRHNALHTFINVLQAHPETRQHPVIKTAMQNIRPNAMLNTDEKVLRFLETVQP